MVHLKGLQTREAGSSVKYYRRRVTHGIGAICGVDTCSIEQEPDGIRAFPLTFTKCIHKLFQCGGTLDLKKNFIVVIGHFDVQVLGLGRFLDIATSAWRLTAIGHDSLCGRLNVVAGIVSLLAIGSLLLGARLKELVDHRNQYHTLTN